MISAALLAALGHFAPIGVPSSVVSLAARSEIRVRTPRDVGGQGGSAWDFDNTAIGTYTLRWHRVELAFSYAPQFVLTDFTGVASSDLLHGFGMASTYRARRWTLNLSEHATYGRHWFSTAAQVPTNPMTGVPQLQATPAPASVLYESTTTTVATSYRLTRRATAAATVSYSVAGGADEESRRTVPLVFGPQASFNLDVAVSQRDTVAPVLTAVWQRTKTGPTSRAFDARTLSLMGRWTRRLAPRTTSELSAGQTVISQEQPRRLVATYPEGALSLTHAMPFGGRPGQLQLAASAGAYVAIDALTGTAQPLARANAQATWIKDRLTLYGQTTAVRPLKPAQSNALSLTSAEAGVRYSLAKPFALEMGVRLGDQEVNAPSAGAAAFAPNGTQYAAFFALVLRPIPTKL